MVRIIPLIFIIVFLPVSSMKECLQIEIQPEIFRVGDKNIQLTCFSSPPAQCSIHEITRLRLRKLTTDNMWTDFAEIHSDGTTRCSDANATVTGEVGGTNTASSFLNVTWDEVTPEVFGEYMCDAVGYTQCRDIEVDQSDTLNVKGLSTDSIRLYQLMQESHRKEAQVMVNMLSDLSTKISELEIRCTKIAERKADAELSCVKYESDTEMWPEGNFSLLMPDTGCPSEPPVWNKGYIRIDENDFRKYDPIIKPQHLAQPYRSDGYVYRHFCSINHSPERAIIWPSGSYCINSYSSKDSCPSGFNYTQLVIPFTVTLISSDGYCYGQLPIARQYDMCSKEVNINYCCRHDASPNAAIDLPVSKPFYLYRHGGTCQQVKGMHVTQDFFRLETNMISYNFFWEHVNTENKPDASIDPLKEELCYYTKRMP